MERYIKNEEVKKKRLIDKKYFVDIEKKIIYFIFSFLISLLTFKEEVIIFVIPILAIGYLLDFGYLFFSICATSLGSIIIGNNNFLLYGIMLFTFCFFIFVSQIVSFKLYTRIGFSVFISDLSARIIYTIGNKGTLNITLLAYSMIAIGMFLLLLNTIDVFLHKKIEKVSTYCALSIGTIIFLAIFGIYTLINNLLVCIILIHFILLLYTNLYDIYLSSFLNLACSLIIYYFLGISFEALSLFIIPTLVASLIGKNKKYQTGVLYVMTYFSLGILLELSIFSFEFVLVPTVTLVLYSCIPNLLINEVRKQIFSVGSFEKENLNHLKKLENELIKKLSRFSNLFDLVSQEYQDEEKYQLARKQTETMYKSLCINCPKNKTCYQSNNDNVSLFLKSINLELTNDEVKKINKNCLKPSRFFELSSSFKNDFYLEYKYDQQYKSLKKALSFQMQGFKELLDNYVNILKIESIPSINCKEEMIKDCLEKINIDVIFIKTKKEIDGKNSFILDIKVKDIKEIYSLVIPSIENVLHCYLKVKELKEVVLENYFSLDVIEYEAYDFIMGIHQRSKENKIIGDSYLNFSDSTNQIFAISDGMGVGEDARVESKETLKLLREILNSGMDIKNTILMINSLLKIKNRYDTYATLDIINIDKKTLKANFCKNGSPFSYIFRNDELIKVDPTSLPIGIVDDIEVYDCSINLEDEDYIIMFSDGISGDERVMKSILKRCKNYHPQILAKEILDDFIGKKVNDDTTVMVIKIKKRNINYV